MLARFRTLPTILLALALLPELGLCVSAPTLGALQTDPADITAADVFPGSTAIYAEIQDPAAVIEAVLAHPILDFAKKQKEYKQFLASPQMAGALLGQGVIEAQLGEPLVDTLKTNLGRGLFFGFDAETEGVAILFRSDDEGKLKKLAGTILNMVASGAKQGNGNGFERKDYRDAKAAQINEALVARYQDWFLITNKSDLAKKILDNLHDGTRTSLASQNWFVQARRQNRENSSDLWAAVDLKTIRMAGVAKELFTGKTDNPAIELVIGGVLDALKNAPVAVAELTLEDRLELSIKTPFQNEWATSARHFFYGENLEGFAPAPLIPKNMIASLTTHRDLGEWWLSKEELFDEQVIAQLAQVDSQFSNFFSPLDFGEEVLGALEPGMQIVVAENTYEPNREPDIKIPAFAMVTRFKDAESIQQNFKVAFQGLIGIVNVNLPQKLDLETEKIGATRVSAASYMYDKDTAPGLMVYNFGPTIAFHGPYFILSSNRQLAVELAELAEEREKSGASQTSETANTRIVVDGLALQKILAENREPLIANNMIEKGNTRAEAEQAIGTVLNFVQLVKSVELDFSVGREQMKLDLGVEVMGTSGR